MTSTTEQIQMESLFSEGGSIRPGWRTALSSMTCLIASPSVLAPICFGVFVPYLRDAFGWTMGDIGWGIAVMSLSVMVTSLVSGFVIDRLGVRPVALVCIPLFGLGFAAMGLQNGALWQFYLAWALIPIFGIGLWPGAWAKATAGWFSARLGLAVAIATLGVGIGATIMPIIINTIAAAHGWRTAYAAIGLGSIFIAFPLTYFFVHEAPASKTLATADTPLKQLTPALFKDLRLVGLIVGFLALGWFSAQVIANLVSILIGNGMTRASAALAMSTIGIGTIFGRVLCGWLLDRMPFGVVVPTFCLGGATAVLALLAGVSGSPVYIVTLIIGMLIGAEMDLLGYAIQRLFGRARFATLFGVIFALFHLGGAMGGLIMGKLHDATNGFALGLTTSLCACVIAAIAFGLIPFGPRKTAAIGDAA